MRYNELICYFFFRVKKRLFDCMKEVMDTCPGSMELTALSGYDHESMKKGIDVLCNDVNGKSVSAINCSTVAISKYCAVTVNRLCVFDCLKKEFWSGTISLDVILETI